MMDEDIKKRLIEIGNNFNGNRKRTIRDLEKLKKDLDEILDNIKERRNDEIKRKSLPLLFGVTLMVILIVGVYASITYRISGENKLQITPSGVIITDNLTIQAPLIINSTEVLVETKPAITDNNTYSVCVNTTGVPCLNWCQLDIKKGLIIGCN